VTGTKTTPASRDLTAELVFLTRALKAPTLRDAVPRLAERARAESWTREEFLAACLQREVSARESHGGEGRIRAARFPARKALEDFDYDYQRSLKRETIAHLGTLDFVTARENVVFLGPPGTGKTMLSVGLGIRACQAGHRVLFATAAEWVARLADAHHAGHRGAGPRARRPAAAGGRDPDPAVRAGRRVRRGTRHPGTARAPGPGADPGPGSR
jgi:DNA replication protein DnaC